ncbi:phosphotransferase family protein [Deinococcus hopiensis]|uniref:phosphotransferase family protein n=1 Tax=Deinococcus hopiensis TaxID=309885 RepID=UPI0009FF6D1F|nr:phosphotransferase [Deinococcus hopiensis]
MDSKTKNRKTREQIAAMAARAFNGVPLANDDTAVRELKDGWFNAAFEVRLADGREVVLKIAPPPGAEVMQYEKNIMASEVAAMRLARQNPAIPVPEIYFHDQAKDLCDAEYFFMEKVDADTLKHVKSTLPPETLSEVEQQIGEIIREVNTFAGTYFGYEGNPELRAPTWREAFLKIFESVLKDAERKKVEFDFGYDEFRGVILKHLAALNEVTTPCLIHWDAWSANFFVKEGQVVGLIDFERSLWAEPLMEAQFRPLFGEGITRPLAKVVG